MGEKPIADPDAAMMAALLRSYIETAACDCQMWQDVLWLAESHRDAVAIAEAKARIAKAEARIRFWRMLALPGELG